MVYVCEGVYEVAFAVGVDAPPPHPEGDWVGKGLYHPEFHFTYDGIGGPCIDLLFSVCIHVSSIS